MKMEKKLYTLLGVPAFKKMILKFETFKHRKKGGHNRNYHPASFTQEGLEQYKRYLVYNALWHIASIALIFLQFLIGFPTGIYGTVLRLCTFAALIFNIYCIMLQRYILIKIRELMSKREVVRMRKIGGIR